MSKFEIQLFAASTDAAARNKEFAESLEVKYPILSDPEGKVAKEYGILGASGRANRVTFVIDKEGIIRYISPRVNVATHGADLAKVLEELGVPKIDG